MGELSDLQTECGSLRGGRGVEGCMCDEQKNNRWISVSARANSHRRLSFRELGQLSEMHTRGNCRKKIIRTWNNIPNPTMFLYRKLQLC